MKITFLIRSNSGSQEPQNANLSLDTPFGEDGYICNLLTYRNLNTPTSSPTFLLRSRTESPLLEPPGERIIFTMTLYWSRENGFTYQEYNRPELSVTCRDELMSQSGYLKGLDKIQLNDQIRIDFTAEANESDLAINDQSDVAFLESCSRFNIKISNTNFRDSNINNADFEGLFLENVSFLGAQVINSNFSSSKLRFCKFENSNFQSSNFSDANLKACSFRSCKIISTKFNRAVFTPDVRQFKIGRGQIFEGIVAACSITSELAEQSIISECEFNGAEANNVDWSNSVIKETCFSDAKLRNSKFLNCKISKSNFTKKESDSVDLKGADFSFSELSNCKFTQAKMDKAQMIQTKISGSLQKQTENDSDETCCFAGASLFGANLQGTNLTRVDLTGVDFRQSDLINVKMSECILHSAKFYRTHRGGLNMEINLDDSNSNSDSVKYKSNCKITCVDWSPGGDGEFQIDEQSFLSIIMGQKSPLSTGDISKALEIYLNNNNFNQPIAKAGDGNTDTSINNAGNVASSEFSTGSIEAIGDDGNSSHDSIRSNDLDDKSNN